MNKVILEAAVEAAAEACLVEKYQYADWNKQGTDSQQAYRESARRILEAAMPHMLQNFANRVDWRCVDCEDPIDPDTALKMLRDADK